MPQNHTAKKRVPRRWLYAAAVFALAAIAATLWVHRDGINARAIEAWVASLGPWAPAGFVVLYALATVAMVPGSIFDAIAGALFGPVFGSVLAMLGGGIGAALAFLVARHFAADWVHRRAGGRIQTVMDSIDAEGWRFVAFVRIVPFFPYNILNYVLGVTRIPFWQYWLTSLVFMAPSTIAYTWLGHAGRGFVAGDDAQKVEYALIAVGVLAAILVLPRLVKRMRKPQGTPPASR